MKSAKWSVAALALGAVVLGDVPAATAASKCDLDGNNRVDQADVRLLTNVVLNKRKCPAGKNCNIDKKGGVNIHDVQVLANVARGAATCPLGGGTTPATPPPSTSTGGSPVLYECFGGASSRLMVHQGGQIKVWANKRMTSFNSIYPLGKWPSVIPSLNNPHITGTIESSPSLAFRFGGMRLVATNVVKPNLFGLQQYKVGTETCHQVERGTITGFPKTVRYKCTAYPYSFGPLRDTVHKFSFNKGGGVAWDREANVSPIGFQHAGVTGAFVVEPGNKITMKFDVVPKIKVGSSVPPAPNLKTTITGRMINRKLYIDTGKIAIAPCEPY